MVNVTPDVIPAEAGAQVPSPQGVGFCPLSAIRDRRGREVVHLRINDQSRICFTWRDGHAHEVEIVDYH
jgi:hypothetical protein